MCYNIKRTYDKCDILKTQHDINEKRLEKDLSTQSTELSTDNKETERPHP